MNLSDSKRKLIFAIIMVSTVMSSMLSTALTTALPSIMEDLEITASTGQWLTSIYSLVMGISLLCTAYLAGRFPTKKLYITALGIFITGLVIDFVSVNFISMLIGRILQATGNGILLAVAQMILLTIYPPEKRGSVMGICGLATAGAPVFAPTLAGIIIDYLGGWRMIFALIAVVCIVSLIGAIFCFENVLESKQMSLDFLSVILCIVTFSGVTVGMGNISSNSIVSLNVGGCFIVGIICGAVFVKRQLKLANPFLNVKVFKNSEFRIAVIGSMVMYMIMMASSMLFPLQLQTVRGVSATTSALVNMPGAIVMAFSTPIVGKLYNRLGARKLFIGGSCCLILFSTVFSFFTVNTPLFMVGLFTVIRCLGVACIMMPLVTYSVSTLPVNDIPSATSLISSLRTVGGSMGSAIFVAFAAIGSKTDLDMGGLNFSYRIMAVTAIILLGIAILGVKSERKEK